MSDEGFLGMQMIDPNEEPNQPQAGEAETGASSAAPDTTGAPGGMDMGGLLGALLGGGAGSAAAGASSAASGGPDMSGLLGALLGGGADAAGAGGLPGASSAGSGGPDLSGLLGALLGGGAGAGSGSGGLAGLLGSLLGGGAGGLNVGGLAAQSGVSQSLIQAAIPLVLGALLGGKQGRSAGVDLASPGRASGDLAGLLQSGEPIDAQALKSTGLPQQLAQSAGVSHDDATSAIQSILGALTGGSGAGNAGA